MKSEITAMYEKRLERSEIKKMPTEMTIMKHVANIEILNQHMSEGNIRPKFIGNVGFLKQSFEDILNGIQTLKGKRLGPIGLSTQQGYLFSVLVAIRTNDFDNYFKDPIWISVNKYLSKDNDFTKKLAEHKKAKDKVLPDYEKIKEAVEAMEEVNDTGLHDPFLELNLILNIYLRYPFRLEVADLIYLSSKKEKLKLIAKEQFTENYLINTKAGYTFAFNDYKTASSYGTRTIVVNDKSLVKLIKNFIKTAEIQNGQEMFSGLSRNTMTQRINTFFEKSINRRVSPTDMTKLLIQSEYEKLGPELKETQERLAKERGHSINTQIAIYLYERPGANATPTTKTSQ